MNKKILFSLSVMILIMLGCKKDTDFTGSMASLRVIHAAVNAGTIKVNYLGRPVTWGNYIGADGSITYGTSKVYSIDHANASYPFTAVPALDTLKPVFNGKLNLEPEDSYSIYLAGTAPVYDTVFVKEIIPIYADSTLGVRFINLVSNSTPVRVVLSGTTGTDEFSNVAYKQQTVFKAYKAKTSVPNTFFTFQVRSGTALLASYTFTTANVITTRFRGSTLVFRGLIGGTGTNGPSLSFIPNY